MQPAQTNHFCGSVVHTMLRSVRSVCAGAMSVVLLLLPSAILRPHYAPGSCTAATTRRSTITAMVSDQQRHN